MMNICHTNIIRVELIHANKYANGGRSQRPGHNRADDGELAAVQVVHNHGVKLTDSQRHILAKDHIYGSHTPI